MIRNFEDKIPQLANGSFVAETALVLGNVRIGKDSSIWYGAVIRGDVHYITVGDSTNIQDCCAVHVTTDTHPTCIGDQVTIGHGAIIHGCVIGGQVLVGMGAIIMDGVEVKEGSVVAAGALLPPGRCYPAKSLIVGAPAEVKRPVTSEELSWIRNSADHYVALARRYAALIP